MEQRMARCSYYGGTHIAKQKRACKLGCEKCSNEVRELRNKCQCEQPSTKTLAFFSAQPDKPYDSFYCGCFGWD